MTTLARDNGYRMVIIITGTSTTLTDQSIRRLREDLRIDKRPDRPWWFQTNPRKDDSLRPIQDRLEDWNDTLVSPELRQTVLITVMKHHVHLKHLSDLLASVPLESAPCLIIDDEGDQASLNTKVSKGDESTTYRRIMELRSNIKHCSYLQYTATPQAPLLINIIDILSPTFAEILQPGTDYVGGEEFFVKQTEILRTIPPKDIFTHHDIPHDPPASLLKALRIFFVSITVGMITDQERGNRTMMIHPSHRTMPHSVVARWVNGAKDLYVEVLGLDQDDPDFHDLVADFRDAYDDLSLTVKDLPPFKDILPRLRRSIRRIVVKPVNATSGKTPIVDWQNSYAHVLVGGQAMDRGFTVKDLNVTYMPRGLGVGNSDTIQQRARFFGYKKNYLSYCRVFLGEDMRSAYSNYVDHEKSLRAQLLEYLEKGQSLHEWRRQFLLPASLKPTRSNIIDVDYLRGEYANQWFIPGWPHFDPSAINSNRVVAQRFLEQLMLRPDPGKNRRTKFQKHLFTDDVELSLVQERLLTRLKLPDRGFAGILLQVKHVLEQYPNATCSVYKMSSDQHHWHSRDRDVDSAGKLGQLMQGRNPKNSGQTYKGDRSIGDKKRIVVQIHNLNLKSSGTFVARDVINVAIWIPRSLATGWLIQEQNSQVH